MRVSAISPSNNGRFKVSKQQNIQKNTPIAAQKADSISFKRADCFFYPIIGGHKQNYFEALKKQMPHFTIPQMFKVVDLFDSIVTVREGYEAIAPKLPDKLNIFVGAKRFGLFSPFEGFVASGFKEHLGFGVKQAEALLETVNRYPDFFVNEEGFRTAKGLLIDALQPKNRKDLEEGRLFINKMLQKDSGQKTVIGNFIRKDQWRNDEDWKKMFACPDRDMTLLGMYYRNLHKHKLLPHIPRERDYNPADYFLPY